jgi:hypothetical protein
MDVEMNICKTCKYWKKLENSYMNDIGICNLIPQYDELGYRKPKSNIKN